MIEYIAWSICCSGLHAGLQLRIRICTGAGWERYAGNYCVFLTQLLPAAVSIA
jgi:hypothetical protein